MAAFMSSMSMLRFGHTCLVRQLLSQSPWKQARCFHTGSVLQFIPKKKSEMPEFEEDLRERTNDWDRFNEIVYPPLKEGQKPRPAEITHYRIQIRYSPQKLWFLACMIRGMSIEEALKQLSFHKSKGSTDIKEVLLEAQEMALRDHNVEYKSNLWIADSLSKQGLIVRGFRKHRALRFGSVWHRHSDYYVRLREGKPPKHYYPKPQTGFEKMEEYIKDMRSRRIVNGL